MRDLTVPTLLMMVLAFAGCGGAEPGAVVYTTSKPADRAGLAVADPDAESVPVELDRLTFSVPAHWAREPDPGAFNLAVWRFRDAAGIVGSLGVSSLPGDQLAGEGLLINVNRWRGQLGLEPVGSARGLLGPPVAGGNTTLRVLDLRGPVDVIGRPARFRIAVLPAMDPQGRVVTTYFFKLSGSIGTVERSSAAFDALLASVRLAGPVPMPRVEEATP